MLVDSDIGYIDLERRLARLYLGMGIADSGRHRLGMVVVDQGSRRAWTLLCSRG